MAWIIQCIVPLIVSILFLRKMTQLHLKRGLIRTLVLLVAVESVCSLFLQILIVCAPTGKVPLVITSFMLGAEVNLKGLALCLFTFQYFSASLEVPEQTRLSNGRMKLELVNTQRTKQLQRKVEILKWVTMFLFLINWILMSVGGTLFAADGYFKSSQTI